MCAQSPDLQTADLQCAATFTCAAEDQQRWRLWGQTTTGAWSLLGTRCFAGAPEPYVPPRVTPGHVLSALRRVGLPELRTQVQPEAKTLVNFDTIFFTDAAPVDVDLTILGQAVEVVATPAEFRWMFGDGGSASTTTPGAPYPARTVTHRYLDAGVTVRPHVEVTYTARFRVGGGAWEQIDGTVTTVGPPTPLRVAEATPVLSGGHQ